MLQSTFFLKKLTSLLMFSGKKKSILKKVVKNLQEFGEKKSSLVRKEKALRSFCLLTLLFHRLKPLLETRKVRRASKNYEVPFFIKPARSLSLLLRWIAQALRKQKLGLMKEEFLALLQDTGSTIREAKSLRTKVTNNIMYSHYRWR